MKFFKFVRIVHEIILKANEQNQGVKFGLIVLNPS